MGGYRVDSYNRGEISDSLLTFLSRFINWFVSLNEDSARRNRFVVYFDLFSRDVTHMCSDFSDRDLRHLD